MESLIFVIFNLFHKKKRYKISSPYYLGHRDLSIFQKFDDFNFINGTFPRFYFFSYMLLLYNLMMNNQNIDFRLKKFSHSCID